MFTLRLKNDEQEWVDRMAKHSKPSISFEVNLNGRSSMLCLSAAGLSWEDPTGPKFLTSADLSSYRLGPSGKTLEISTSQRTCFDLESEYQARKLMSTMRRFNPGAECPSAVGRDISCAPYFTVGSEADEPSGIVPNSPFYIFTKQLFDTCEHSGVKQAASTLECLRTTITSLGARQHMSSIFPVIRAAISAECERANSPTTLFRENTPSCTIVCDFCKTHGAEYIKELIRPLLEMLRSGGPPDSPALDASESVNEVASAVVDRFLEHIFSTDLRCPESLHKALRWVSEESDAAFGNGSGVTAVSTIFSLRLLTPLLLSPEDEWESPNSRSLAIKTAKSLQHIVSLAVGHSSTSKPRSQSDVSFLTSAAEQMQSESNPNSSPGPLSQPGRASFLSRQKQFASRKGRLSTSTPDLNACRAEAVNETDAKRNIDIMSKFLQSLVAPRQKSCQEGSWTTYNQVGVPKPALTNAPLPVGPGRSVSPPTTLPSPYAVHLPESGIQPLKPASPPSLPSGSKEEKSDIPATSRLDESTWTSVSIADFKYIRTLGKGAFGRVLMVKRSQDSTHYALKCVSRYRRSVIPGSDSGDDSSYKDHVGVKHNDVLVSDSGRGEASLQAVVGAIHVGVPRVFASLDCPQRSLIVMDCVLGGELGYHLKRSGRFPTSLAKFYIAELVDVVDCMHSVGIVHRDVKLENLLLSATGHLRFIDFGSAIRTNGEMRKAFAGTPGYQAPEMIRGEAYGYSVDWWGVGVVLFAMLVGKPPFPSEGDVSRPDIRHRQYERALRGMPDLPSSLPLDEDSVDILEKLLDVDARSRLGSRGGGASVKAHRFFSGIDWKAVRLQSMTPPFRPVPLENDPDRFGKEASARSVEQIFRSADEQESARPDSKNRSSARASRILLDDGSNSRRGPSRSITPTSAMATISIPEHSDGDTGDSSSDDAHPSAGECGGGRGSESESAGIHVQANSSASLRSDPGGEVAGNTVAQPKSAVADNSRNVDPAHSAMESESGDDYRVVAGIHAESTAEPVMNASAGENIAGW
eukprot:Rmarinus@m.2286